MMTLVLLILCSFLLAPLGYPGYLQPHTGFLPIYALYDWETSGLSLLWTPASFANPLHGEGLLPYALAEGLRCLGLSGPDAIKAVFALAILAGASGAYTLFAGMLPPLVALALALVWAYAPMSVAAVYVRGLPGAALALGLVPWLAWGMNLTSWFPSHSGKGEAGAPLPVLERARPGYHERDWGKGLLFALAAGLSHFGFTLVALLALALMAAVYGRGRSCSWPAIGLGLAAAWTLWHGLGRPSDVTPQFVQLHQLLAYRFGYGANNMPWGSEAPAPLSLGVLPVGLLAAAAVLAPGGWRQRQWQQPMALAAVLVALASPLARPLWAGDGLATLLAGPWQLVALAGFLVLLTAAAPVGSQLAFRPEVAAAVAVLSLVLAIPTLDVPLTSVAPAVRPLASFDGGHILLVRAELHGPLRHGATPRLWLYWQATRPIERDYTVFIHVLDAQGNKWSQRDSWPGNGKLPTSAWRPGALILDEQPVYVNVDGPREGYYLLLGLYDLETGQRLLIDGGGDALELNGG